MKKILCVLLLLLSSCQLSDIKYKKEKDNQSNQNYSAPKFENKNLKNEVSNPNPKQDNEIEIKKIRNNISSKNNDDLNYNLSNEEKQYLLPKVGRNFEENQLSISKSSNKKIKVALFLPFTGKNSELAYAIYNSALLSLFKNDTDKKIELVIFDSKDSVEDNQKAFKAIIESKIKIVIGPIYTNNTIAIEKLAKDNDITVISLSNNHELLNKTTDYGGIFVGGILLESQIDKIVNYSMDNGKFNFAVLAPNNQYGKVITEYLKKFVRARDGNFITAEYYQQNNTDIDRATQKIVNSFNVPTSTKNRDTSYLSDYDRIYPQVILIPESGKNLSKIVSYLKNNNKDDRDFQYIGTSQWDDITIASDINLLGGWFASPENQRFRDFEQNYYQQFQKLPPRIASIAYDAVLAISTIAQNKKNQKLTFSDFTNYTDNKINGFVGIDGVFRFLPNGAVQRNLAVIQVGNGKFETLESSIDRFLKY